MSNNTTFQDKTAMRKIADILHKNPNQFIDKEDTLRLILVNGVGFEEEERKKIWSEACEAQKKELWELFERSGGTLSARYASINLINAPYPNDKP